MPRYDLVLLLVFSVSAGAAAGEPLAGESRPNLILCMTDDQGWGDVGYQGLKRIATPNLDAMAANGLRCDRYYAQPSCSPTRASVMTGRHPNRMGVFWPGMPLRKQEVTIAQVAQQAGYATGHFGKWHLNGVAGPGKVIPDSDPLSPRHFGFDESFSVSNYFELDWTFGHNGVAEKATGDGSEVIVSQALTFIGDATKRRQPFLAVVWFGSPHVPHQPLPADLAAAGGSGYYAEILAVDRSMGTLRSGLRTMGIADNTVLWFSSDNGGWLDPKKPDAHGTNLDLRGRKGDVWEGGIRVPAIIEWPAKITRPTITTIPVGVVDIFPTIIDLLHLTVGHPVPLDGISLVPLLEGTMTKRPRPLGFWQHAGPSAWTDNQYKLVKTTEKTWSLFDIVADRTESNDLAEQQPEILARMKNELETWIASVKRSQRGEDYPEGLVTPSP